MYKIFFDFRNLLKLIADIPQHDMDIVADFFSALCIEDFDIPILKEENFKRSELQ